MSNAIENTEISLRHPLLEQLRLRSSGSMMHENCCVNILTDSRENFPAWLEAVQAAEHFILMEMYIFADNEFGVQMRNLLLQKQQAGVQVVLVYDWFGCLVQSLKGFFEPLRRAGALIVPYNRIGFASGLGLLSRNHRKSFVIDGHTAFVSGLCISSAWNGQPEKNVMAWRDTGLKLKGKIVYDVMTALEDTLMSQGHSLPASIKQTTLAACTQYAGSQRAALVATTSADNNMMRLDLNALALANHHLWLTDAYFMPTRLYTQALINAARSGVDVRILVPRTSDIRWIARVSRTRYRELLQAGVRIFEWNGTMIHAKSAIADGIWARVGSTNLNLSSWHFNRELDVVIEDKNLIDDLEKQFLRDLQNSTEMVLNEDDRAVAQASRRQWLTALKITNRQQAQAVARQILQLSHAFEGNFYGANIVDESESKAYLSLGLTLLIFALLLWFAPYLLVVPVMLLLLIGGISTTWYALKQRHKFKSKAQKSDS